MRDLRPEGLARDLQKQPNNGLVTTARIGNPRYSNALEEFPYILEALP